MKRKLAIISSIIAVLLILFLVLNYKPEIRAYASQPEIHGKYGISIDAKTGEILYGKNDNDAAAPASLTKMMTALLLLEKVKPDEEITITRHALDTESHTSKITLHPGEKLKRDEALKLMLVISVDPVAESIAEHISGSTDKFAKLMNKRAKELGAKQTSFLNASGKDALMHKLSAHDLALITQAAIQHPEVLQCMNTVTTTVHTSLQQKKISNFGRKDLYNDPYAIGSKSGRTMLSGYTLVTIDEKDGRRVINVVFKSDLDHLYDDAKIMADYAFK
ncbi:D-alanyl-D-alanine carboxypeptidase family protein [Microbacteriaceae bacterium 4G12]